MEKRYKIAVIGDMESVLGFKSVGFEVIFSSDPESAGNIVKELVRAQEYAVIYITETLMSKMEDTVLKYRELALPAIIGIPDKSGNTGGGIDRIKKSVERAVGADILFKNES